MLCHLLEFVELAVWPSTFPVFISIPHVLGYTEFVFFSLLEAGYAYAYQFTVVYLILIYLTNPWKVLTMDQKLS